MIGIEDEFIIAPPSWPTRSTVAPGDLSQYAPIGLGLTAPPVVMPWDTLDAVLGRSSFYGANERTGDPLRDAPLNESGGGIIYFDGRANAARLITVFEFLGVAMYEAAYAVFAAESADVRTDRYLAQIRIVPFAALKLFGAIPDDGDRLVPQRLSIGRLIGRFMAAQQTIWESDAGAKLGGALGGDGDWATESFAFGFMIENASNGIYRLWSRPWLVTK